MSHVVDPPRGRLVVARHRVWAAPLTLILLVSAVAVAANLVDPTLAAVLRAVAGLAAVAALLWGSHHHRATPKMAWALIGGGVLVWVSADALWDGMTIAGTDPGSGWFVLANVLYLTMYPALFAAVILLAGPLARHGDVDNIIDCAILLLTGVLVLRLFVVDTTVTGDSTADLFTAAYPFGDALLLGGIAWLLFSTYARNGSMWLLASGMAAMLGADIAWDLQGRFPDAVSDAWVNPAYPLAYAVIAAAALHHDLTRLGTPLRPGWHIGPWARLVFLCVSLTVVTGAALFGSRDDGVVRVTSIVLLAVIVVRLALLVRDTEHARRRAEASDRRFRLLATAAPVGIYEVNPALQIVFANDESELIIGGTMVGMVDDGFRLLAVDDVDRTLFQQAVQSVIDGSRASAQFRIRASDGTHRWVAWFGTPAQPGDGRFAGAFVSTIDITALKDAEALLALQATHDPLTLLPNRRLLLDRLSGALTRLGRRPGLLAVLFLDLDGFKQVNDQLGHDAGDDLLKVAAARILETIRTQDTVARFGGDEFVVVLEHVADRSQAALVAQKIIAAMGVPIFLGGNVVDVSVSVGIALTSDPGQDPDTLLRGADTAMYGAKKSGPGRFQFYDDVDTDDLAPLLRPGELRPLLWAASAEAGASTQHP